MSFQTAVDRRNEGKVVEFDSSGQPWEVDAKFFIGTEEALKGIEYFLLHKERHPEITWEDGFRMNSDF